MRDFGLPFDTGAHTDSEGTTLKASHSHSCFFPGTPDDPRPPIARMIEPGVEPFSDEAQPLPAQLPPRRGLKSVFAWGLLDQLLRSATNFGLSLFAGRLLGVSGLGVIAIGFSAYLIVLSFHRALVSEPLIIVSSVREPDVRGGKTRSSITATACRTR